MPLDGHLETHTWTVFCSINKEHNKWILQFILSVLPLNNLIQTPTSWPLGQMWMCDTDPALMCVSGHCLFKFSLSLPPTGVVKITQDTYMFESINEVLLPPFLSDIVGMLCTTVNVTVGGHSGVYFSEPFTLGADAINLIFPLSESRLLLPSHTFLQFGDSKSFSALIRYRLVIILVLGEYCGVCWAVTSQHVTSLKQLLTVN